MTDNVEELVKCTKIENVAHIRSYIRNIAMALQLDHETLMVSYENYIPSADDIPTIKDLIGGVDSEVLKLMNIYLSNAENCFNNTNPEGYGKLTETRDSSCMDVADRVREVIKIIQQEEHQD